MCCCFLSHWSNMMKYTKIPGMVHILAREVIMALIVGEPFRICIAALPRSRPCPQRLHWNPRSCPNHWTWSVHWEGTAPCIPIHPLFLVLLASWGNGEPKRKLPQPSPAGQSLQTSHLAQPPWSDLVLWYILTHAHSISRAFWQISKLRLWKNKYLGQHPPADKWLC